MIDYNIFLKEEEEAEVIIHLTSNNPQKLKNVVRFDFNSREFLPAKIKPQTEFS